MIILAVGVLAAMSYLIMVAVFWGKVAFYILLIPVFIIVGLLLALFLISCAIVHAVGNALW